MAIAATMEEGSANRRLVRGELFRSDLMVETGGIGAPTPNCKLIEQPPHSTIGAHFHVVDQFQVVVQGGGKLGKHDVAPLTLHFAAAHTPYGPIDADDRGIQYMVLRNGVDVGAAWMPESASKMERGRRRHVVADSVSPMDPAEIRRLDTVSREEVIAQAPDGLASWLLRIPPLARIEGPDPGQGGGHFVMVVSGQIDAARKQLSPRGCVYVGATESALVMQAGRDGAEVLVMQFPRHAEASA